MVSLWLYIVGIIVSKTAVYPKKCITFVLVVVDYYFLLKSLISDLK